MKLSSREARVMFAPYVALVAAVFLGAVVSGFSGFAFSAVAGAILLRFVSPTTAVPLMMACSIATQALSMARLRQKLEWRRQQGATTQDRCLCGQAHGRSALLAKRPS